MMVHGLPHNEIETKEALALYERSVNIKNCIESATMTQVLRTKDKSYVLMLIVSIMQSFCNSLKIKDTLSIFEIMDFAKDYIERFRNESVDDLVMALKSSKQRGDVSYARFTLFELNAILNKHFENKAQYLERQSKYESYQNNLMEENIEEHRKKIRDAYVNLINGKAAENEKVNKISETKEKAVQVLKEYEANAKQREEKKKEVEIFVTNQIHELINSGELSITKSEVK